MTETVADAVQAVRDTSDDTWIVAATEPGSCSTVADGFGFTRFEACSDASVVTPVVFAEFRLSEDTLVPWDPPTSSDDGTPTDG